MKIHRQEEASFVRNFVFGVEDSLVSTVGLLSGISVSNVSRETVLLTGVVLIFVEAFSMAVGSFLSESAGEEFSTHRAAKVRKPLLDGLIMFGSYFVSGFVPLAPYLWMSPRQALWISIAVSLVALLGLGLLSARIAHIPLLKNGLKMLAVGAVAIVVGVVVGRLLSI